MAQQPDPAKRIAAAERDAAMAKERLTRTVAQLQDKLSPKQIARRAMSDATDRGNAAVDTARRNPGATAGLVAVAGLFLARRRIASLFRRKRSTTVKPYYAYNADAN